MKKVTPLIVSGTAAMSKTSFSSRLVQEYPDIFTLPSGSHIPTETAKALQENKIPIFHSDAVEPHDI